MLKAIWKTAWVKPLFMLIAPAMLLMSFRPEANASLNLFATMDGQSIFKAILFKEGAVGKQFLNADDAAVMQNLDADHLRQIAQVETAILAELAKKDPAYFEHFKTSITSTDYNTVAAALKTAQEDTKQAAQKIYSLKNSQLSVTPEMRQSLKQHGLSSSATACVAVLVVALVVFLAFIPLVTTGDVTATPLQNEMLVGKIVHLNSLKIAKS